MFLKLYHDFLSPSTSFNLRWEEAIAEILQGHPAVSRFALVLTGLVIIVVSKAFSTPLTGHPGVWSVGWLFCRFHVTWVIRWSHHLGQHFTLVQLDSSF